MINTIWRYWCKAMGSRAYDNEKQDDHIHLTEHYGFYYTSPLA